MKSFKKVIYKNLFNNICDHIFGKGLIYISFIIAIILFITQIGMGNDYIRPYLSNIEVFEGHYINEMDSLIKKGSISLQLINMNKETDVKVLVNGIGVSSFYNNIIDVEVKNHSILEIDGCEIKSPVKVRVISKSKNIKNDILNQEFTTNSNIKLICRINID